MISAPTRGVLGPVAWTSLKFKRHLILRHSLCHLYAFYELNGGGQVDKFHHFMN